MLVKYRIFVEVFQLLEKYGDSFAREQTNGSRQLSCFLSQPNFTVNFSLNSSIEETNF